ncbi:MBL fold metallo-hydrolase|uniref:Glyoxylase, beta-lactamase superfamily II n=1 Tax=Dendrosporobacter quercicolus TaxID=146817 RepID=A0A1G9NEA2_9FIRM|nr:MBL fold metallo-hydrolase [Dendrosporobacter quercicolus]NSL47312.1 MBL fold metallo-hydrolase [Dendrosporobacter quercicolus DSM 1736]SDL84789.1 Glyoxylase, beta-lactamase superfamily II [Dendrosporobacter quercicolus]
MTSVQVYQLYLQSLSFKNYCYIIVDTATNLTAIIDPAWELDTIELALNKLNAKLVMILLTHSHPDHVDLVHPLLEKYQTQVVMSAKEINFYGFSCKNLTPIENNDFLKLGNTMIKCLLTPGHTAGSVCFLVSDSYLFTGDTIFIEGCGICNTDGGNAEEMYHSIQMIKKTVPPDILVYPAHSYGKKPGYPLSYLFKENIYFQINKLEHFIAFRMRKNQPNPLQFY